MSDVPISALPAAGTLSGAELVPVVQNGVTVRTTAGAIGASDLASDLGILSVFDFGATGNGVTDDTAAILAAEAASAPGGLVWFPPGTYVFTSALSSTRQRFCWQGAGFGQSILLYKGASTIIDLLTVGDGVSAIKNATIGGLTIQSNTTMTAGAAAHLKGFVRSVVGLEAQGQDGTATLGNRLWHGIWFDQCDDVLWNSQAYAQTDCLRVNGGALGNADLYIGTGSKISQGAVGIHCGGGFGGLNVGQCDIIQNGINVLIDQGITAVTNREVFLVGAVIDVNTSAGVKINDPGGPFVSIAGSWIASSTAGFGIWVTSSTVGGYVYVDACRVFNNFSDGIRVDNATTIFSVSGGQINNNGGWGLNPTVAGNAVNAVTVYSGNTSGALNATHPATSNQYFATSLYFDTNFFVQIQGGAPTVSLAANTYMAYASTGTLTEFFNNSVGSFTVGPSFSKNPPTTFSALPAAATAGDGARSFITDSTLAYNSTNLGATAVGGSTNHSPLVVVGGVWVIG